MQYLKNFQCSSFCCIKEALVFFCSRHSYHWCPLTLRHFKTYFTTLELMDCFSTEASADRVLTLSMTQRALGMIQRHSNILFLFGFGEVVHKAAISLAQKLSTCSYWSMISYWCSSNFMNGFRSPNLSRLFFLDISTEVYY